MKILHFADIQIEPVKRTEEFKTTLNRFLETVIKQDKFDYIVASGDIFEEHFCDHTNKEIMSSFFNECSKQVGKYVLITKGNHDLKQVSNTMTDDGKIVPQLDILDEMVSTMNNPKVVLFSETGFYEFGDNIVWCVFDHKTKFHKYLNKPYSPYFDGFVKDPSKTYIDIFHDPVDGCVDFSEKEVRLHHAKSLEEFRGDFSLFGDIHQPQTFCEGTKGYSSSLVIRDYGEGDYYKNDIFFQKGLENHGYNILDLSDKNPKLVFHPLHNDWSWNTFMIDDSFDFEDIKIKIENPAVHNNVKIRVMCNHQKFTPQNSQKLHDYFLENYNISDYRIDYSKTVRVDVKTDDILNEEGDLDLSVENQKNLLENYLESHGITDKTNFLRFEMDVQQNIKKDSFEKYKNEILSVKIKNFKSIKGFDMDFMDLNGLVLINGLNESGKTSLTQAIQWCLTNKIPALDGNRQKYQELDIFNSQTTDTEMYVEIKRKLNGGLETIKRYVELSYKKTGQNVRFQSKEEKMQNMPSTGGVKKGLHITKHDGIILEKTDAEAYLKKTIGDYDDYNKLIETNSDTLNNLIGLDKEDKLVEYILSVRGLGVYEEKKAVFAQLKESYLADMDKLSIKPNEVSENIKKKEKELDGVLEFLVSENKKLGSFSFDLDVQKQKIDEVKKGLTNVDYKLLSEESKKMEEILVLNQKIRETEDKIAVLKNEVKNFTNDFDEGEYRSLLNRLDVLKTEIGEITNKALINSAKKDYLTNEAINLETKKENLKKSFIEKTKNALMFLEKDYGYKKESHIQKQNNEIKSLLEDIKNRGKVLGLEVENIKNNVSSNSEQCRLLSQSKNCPTCKKPKDEDSIFEINSKIDSLMITIEKDKVSILEKEKELQSFRDEYSRVKETKIFTYSDPETEMNIQNLRGILENPDYSEIQNDLDATDSEINAKYSEIESVMTEKRSLEQEKAGLNDNLGILVSKMREQENKEAQNKVIKTKIQVYELVLPKEIMGYESRIMVLRNELNLCDAEKNKRDKNGIIEKQLLVENMTLAVIEKQISETNFVIKGLTAKETVLGMEIKNEKTLLEKYAKRKALENEIKVYEQSLGKNGLPLTIFRHEAKKINALIQNFLEGLNFNVYFDINTPNCDLKMMDMLGNRSEINVLFGSGMQRTFAVIALIGALLSDTKNKMVDVDFRVFDEITGKLSGGVGQNKGVDKNDYQKLFISLINKMKKHFKFILFIDHVLDKNLLGADVVIDVYKVLDSDGDVYSKYDIIKH